MCNIILFLTEGNAFQLGEIDEFSFPPNFEFYSLLCEISLVVQWLRLHTPNAGGIDPWSGNYDPTFLAVWPKINIQFLASLDSKTLQLSVKIQLFNLVLLFL